MNTPTVTPPPLEGWDIEAGTLIIGAGACGLVAALAAAEAGQEVLVVEADAVPAGSTSLSAGLIPAAGTSMQRNAGIQDTPELFAADIQNKARHENNPDSVNALTNSAAEVIDWHAEKYGLPFSLIEDFDYPGHSCRRMHGLPTRSGAELVNALRKAVEDAGVDIICNRRASILHANAKSVAGVTVVNTADGTHETIGCEKLVLACNGFGGNRDMVKAYMPEISDAVWFGHSGNQGEAVRWGESLGAAMQHLGAYQGHGNVAHPHGTLITWAVIMEGGIQVNSNGHRFWNETQGYSEAARAVMSQPGGVAVTIFDKRIAAIARQFADFKQAESLGAVISAESLDELALKFDLPAPHLKQTFNSLPIGGIDEFDRRFAECTLQAPYCAVRVTAALFHTQGGLQVDSFGRVLSQDGEFFENVFAGGGAACGVSGSGDAGYLSGNGLLSAVVLGYRAGGAICSITP